MRIKDQEKLLEAVRQYLKAKNAYLLSPTSGVTANYLEADKILRDAYADVAKAARA